MNKRQAKQIILQQLFRQRGPYICFVPAEAGAETTVSLNDDIWSLHCFAGEPVQEIRLALMFRKECVDAQAYPYPCAIKSEHLVELMLFVNFMNSEILTLDCSGRFFVDEGGLKVSYSTHIDYAYLEAMPREIVEQGALSFLAVTANVANLLYYIGSGEMTAEEARQQIITRFRDE